MRAAIDHVGIPATNPEAAGTFLAWVLDEGNVIPDGPPEDAFGDMYSLLLDGWSLAFVRAVMPAPVHLAIRVSSDTFDGAAERLKSRGIPFGNDPEDAENGQLADPLGGGGRVYFKDPDDHLYELVVA